MALDERVVDLVDRALTEGVLQHGVGALPLADHHHAGRAHVEALDDALTLGGTAGRDPEAGRGQVPDHGGAGPPRRGVHRDPDRFVEDDDRVIVVDDPDPLDELGLDRHRVGDRGHRRLEHRPAVDAVALARHLAVQAHVTVGDERRGPGAREPEHPCHGRVDTLPGQTVRDGDDPLLPAVRPAHGFVCRTPVIPMPRQVWMTISTTAASISMSATLNTGQCGSSRKSTT
jgi:hypothetical protein